MNDKTANIRNILYELRYGVEYTPKKTVQVSDNAPPGCLPLDNATRVASDLYLASPLSSLIVVPTFSLLSYELPGNHSRVFSYKGYLREVGLGLLLAHTQDFWSFRGERQKPLF